MNFSNRYQKIEKVTFLTLIYIFIWFESIVVPVYKTASTHYQLRLQECAFLFFIVRSNFTWLGTIISFQLQTHFKYQE